MYPAETILVSRKRAPRQEEESLADLDARKADQLHRHLLASVEEPIAGIGWQLTGNHERGGDGSDTESEEGRHCS